jgi:hypothetical protein
VLPVRGLCHGVAEEADEDDAMARMKTVAAAGRRRDGERGRRIATLRCGGDVGRWAPGHRGDCQGGVTEHGRGAAAIFF